MPSRSDQRRMPDATRPPDSLRDMLACGQAALKERRFEDAHAAFASALEQDPRQRSALIGIAWALRGLGDHGGALEHFRKALSLAPEDPKLLRNVVREARGLGRLEEALRLADEALRLHPADSWFAVERARALEALDNELGRVAWREAAALAPDDVDSVLALARAAERDHDPFTSAGTLRRAVRTRPGERRLLLALALSEIELGRGRAALEALDALRSAPNSDRMGHAAQRRATELRIRAHLLLGQPKEAIEALDSGMDAARDPEAGSDAARGWESTWRGEIAAASWDLPVAEEHLERALAIEPTLARARRLAQLRLAGLDPLGAREAWHVGTGLAQALQGGRAPDVPWRVTAGLIGDLINEYLLEPDLTAEARTALLRDDVEAARSLVRRAPDSQAAATGLLVILRRIGALSGVADPVANGEDRRLVPRRLNQAWLGSAMPDDVQRLVSRWKSQHEGWTHVLIDDREALDLVQQRQRPEETAAFRVAPNATWRADLLRLILLDECGGFWVDADDLPLASLNVLAAGASFVSTQEPFGALGNHLLGAIPGHPVVRSALEEVIVNICAGAKESPWLAAGPGPLTRALARGLAGVQSSSSSKLAQGAGSGDGIRVLDLHERQQIVSGFRRLAYKSTAVWWRNHDRSNPRPALGSAHGRPRDLLCSVTAGLGDALREIATCLLYAHEHGRRLVVHTERIRLPLPFVDCFDLAPMGDESTSILIDVARWRVPVDATVFPPEAADIVSEAAGSDESPQLATRVSEAIRKARDRGRPLTFEFSRDHTEDVLVHDREASRWSRPRIDGRAIDALRHLALKPWLVQEVEQRVSRLPSEYVGIHIRNTDIRSNHVPFLLGIREELADRDVLVCSDDAGTIEDARLLLPQSRVLQVSFPHQTQGASLHADRHRDPRRSAVDLFADLFALSRATQLRICPTRRNDSSLFAHLAQQLHDSPELQERLLRRS